jgi:heme/copper-type cytochrome/quinol oxidase subunit 2
VLHDRRRLLLLILIPAAIVAMAMVISFVVMAEDVTPPQADAGPDLVSDDMRPVQFDASASTDDTGIVRYSWSFDYGGEAVTLEGMRTYFPFEVNGEYEVILEVSDAGGNTDTDSLTVTVLTPPGCPPT